MFNQWSHFFIFKLAKLLLHNLVLKCIDRFHELVNDSSTLFFPRFYESLARILTAPKFTYAIKMFHKTNKVIQIWICNKCYIQYALKFGYVINVTYSTHSNLDM